jgi:hypothetical protein
MKESATTASANHPIRMVKIMEFMIHQIMMFTIPIITYRMSSNLKWALMILSIEWILKLMVISIDPESKPGSSGFPHRE